eukprot:7382153-Prymnesium_polylepis.2
MLGVWMVIGQEKVAMLQKKQDTAEKRSSAGRASPTGRRAPRTRNSVQFSGLRAAAIFLGFASSRRAERYKEHHKEQANQAILQYNRRNRHSFDSGRTLIRRISMSVTGASSAPQTSSSG